MTGGLPPPQLDVRAAIEVDDELAERSQKLAQKGAELARDAGFEPEALAVADEVDTPVAETIVNVAADRGAAAIVIGAHGHSRLSEVVLGSTSQGRDPPGALPGRHCQTRATLKYPAASMAASRRSAGRARYCGSCRSRSTRT